MALSYRGQVVEDHGEEGKSVFLVQTGGGG
jgi:hypothetical protein